MFQVPPCSTPKRTQLPSVYVCCFFSPLKSSLFHITSVENNQVEDGPSVTKEQEEMIQLLGELEAEIIYTTCATIRISPETRVASLSNSVPE